MSLGLYLRSEAKTELREAFSWYEERRRGLGFEFLRAARVALAAIERSPMVYPVALDDIRKTAMPRLPYVIYFVVRSSALSVLAVIHERRHPRRWQSRR